MKHRFEVLDIFRGIFASMVVFFHMSGLPNMDFSKVYILNNNFVLNSDLFVDFFFVLSGFVITYTAQGMSAGGDLQVFYKKRVFRLYPLHFIMLMAFVCIQFMKKFFVGHIQVNDLTNTNNNITTFFSNLFLLNSVKLPGVTDVSWNNPSWSISAEMLSYLLFGLTVWLIHRFKIYKSRVYVFAAIALGSFLALHLITGGFILNYIFDYGFLRGFIGFFTGAVCFNAFSASRERFINKPAIVFHAAELFCIALMIIMICNGFLLKPHGFVFDLLFFASIYVFAFERGIVSRLLKKSGFLKKVGTYSYSIYMIHALLLSLFNIVFIRVLKLPSSSYWYLFALNYLLIYLVSQWTYKHIELEFQVKKKPHVEK